MHGEKKIEGGVEEAAVGVDDDAAAVPRRLSPSPSLPLMTMTLAQIGLHLHPSCLFDQSSTRTEEQTGEELWEQGRSCAME
jgi:hypothetical protein